MSVMSICLYADMSICLYVYMSIFDRLQNEYKVQNATLDADVLLHMPGIPGYYWKMRVVVTAKKSLVSCTDIEGELHHNPPSRMRTG